MRFETEEHSSRYSQSFPEAGNPAQRYLLGRVGFYADPAVIVMRLADQEAHADPYDWQHARTMGHAHLYITEHFHALQDGDVVDVRYILGETSVPAASEATDA